VAQEALTNAVRHAKASRVSILLTEGPKGVSLVVEDDGEGFDPARAGRGHLGLVHMRERVEVLGGQLELETAPGRGTSVYVHLPQKEVV
jgi:signal transduction histidine kinase